MIDGGTGLGVHIQRHDVNLLFDGGSRSASPASRLFPASTSALAAGAKLASAAAGVVLVALVAGVCDLIENVLLRPALGR